MLVGMIRPRGVQTVEVTGPSLEDVQSQLEALRPDGFELVNSPAEMIKGAALIKTTGTFERRDDVTEIEADDMAALEAKVPDGWQLLSVRSV
ncbi:hypothetical protein GCM10009651_35660 [Microbacterium natoriense]|uniref:hypothetical protein n=1 Tax=Microbacterium natoriense TaxID=284570 RepID=UPI0031D4644F